MAFSTNVTPGTVRRTVSAAHPTTIVMSSTPAARRMRAFRERSVSPPTVTRHFGISPLPPFSREPRPAARMIPLMSVPLCRRQFSSTPLPELTQRRGYPLSLVAIHCKADKERRIHQRTEPHVSKDEERPFGDQVRRRRQQQRRDECWPDGAPDDLPVPARQRQLRDPACSRKDREGREQGRWDDRSERDPSDAQQFHEHHTEQ